MSILIPLVAVFLVLISPFVLFVILTGFLDDLRLHRRLRQTNRILTWPAAREKVLAGTGSLIAVAEPKGPPVRIWWIPNRFDPATTDCPLPTLRALEANFINSWSQSQQPSAVAWCKEHVPFHLAALVNVPRHARLRPMFVDVPDALVRVIHPAVMERYGPKAGTNKPKAGTDKLLKLPRA